MQDTPDIEIRDFDKAFLDTGSFGFVTKDKALQGIWVGRINDYEVHGKYKASADLEYTPEVLVHGADNTPAKMTADNIVVQELVVDSIHPLADEEQMKGQKPPELTEEVISTLLRQKQQQLDETGVELEDNVDAYLGYGDNKEHIKYNFKEVLEKNGHIRQASIEKNPFTMSIKEDELLTADTKISKTLGLTSTKGSFTVSMDTPFLTADGHKIDGSIELDVAFKTEDEPWLKLKTPEVKDMDGNTVYEPQVAIESGLEPNYITTKIVNGRYYDSEGTLLSNNEDSKRIDHIDPLFEKALQQKASYVATHYNELTNNPEKTSQLKGLPKGLLSGFSIKEKQVSELSISDFSNLERITLNKASRETYPINESLGGVTELKGALGSSRNNKSIKGQAWMDVEGQPTKIRFTGSFEKNYEADFNGDLENPDLITVMKAEDINIRHVGLATKENQSNANPTPLDKTVADNIRSSLNKQLATSIENRMNNNTEQWLKEELESDLSIDMATSKDYPVVETGKLTQKQLQVADDLLKVRENVFGTSKRLPIEYSLASENTVFKDNDIKSVVMNALGDVKPEMLVDDKASSFKNVLELDLNDESQELYRNLTQQLSISKSESDFSKVHEATTNALASSKALRASVYVNEYYRDSISIDGADRKEFMSNLHDGFAKIALENHNKNIADASMTATNDNLSLEEQWLNSLYEESRREQQERENHPSYLKPEEMGSYEDIVKTSADNIQGNIKSEDQDYEADALDASETLDELLSKHQVSDSVEIKSNEDTLDNEQEQDLGLSRPRGPSM